MPTNAQLQAEIDRLNQGMPGRTRVPTNLPKFTGKRGEDGLKQTAAIETYYGEYSALIFRVELDQVLNYANGFKPCTHSCIKLEGTLSAAMDLAIKYEATYFVDDVCDNQSRKDERKISTDQVTRQDKPFKWKISVVMDGSSRDMTPSVLKAAPASTARNLVT
ncbi:unnamed protein product [Phytophthora fragariaefolia]|uniref:Unnamed protein product n=1 Tax=Phytophthora fragariaefolia TaxID=1490495 RepID=A0A9W6TM53_9STRA|nr:unnamed protein product [Phytophthora fragariaefolia]